MAKRFRIELGFLGLAFVFVLLVCLFLWMFILGVWFGQKMVGKGPSPVAEKTLKERVPEELPAAEEVAPPKVVGMEEQKESPAPEVPNEVTTKERAPAPTPATSSSGPSPPPESPPPSKEKPPATSKEKPSTGPYYTLQVASFKTLSEAERYARFFRDRGYFSRVVKVELPRKGVWYRVYVGKFKSLAEAKEAYHHLKQKKLVKQAYIKRVD